MIEGIDINRLPKHIAVIMDGNGRWANKRSMPRVFGHRAGVEALKGIVTACSDIGIKYFTVYAFSTENWKRPSEEVSFLMNLLVEFMRKEIKELNKNNVKINILGDLTALPEITRTEIEKAVVITKDNTGLNFNIAMNYGGRTEIIMAIKNIAQLVASGNIEIENIDEALVNNMLYTKSMPDPDIILRTSGEQRLSNFLLWQGAYSELVFTDIYWPDFKKENLIECIADFQKEIEDMELYRRKCIYVENKSYSSNCGVTHSYRYFIC